MTTTIIDLENKKITIDLQKIDEAIETVDFYRNFKHENRGFEKSNEKLNIYWNDLYTKLLILKKNHSSQEKKGLIQ